MKNLKIVNDNDLKDWAKEIFKKNSFKMIDVSKKKETFRRALASGKIYVGDEVFELIKNKKIVVKIGAANEILTTVANGRFLKAINIAIKAIKPNKLLKKCKPALLV